MNETELKINVAYLQEYKQEHKLTNRAFAQLIGVHESSISRILRKRNGIGFKFIYGVIQNANNIDLNKLLKIED